MIRQKKAKWVVKTIYSKRKSVMGTQKIGAVAKALQILSLFKFNKAEWGVTEIARELGMQKSTVFRLLATMQEFGIVRKTREGTGYRLGMRIFELGSVVANTFDLRDIALSYLHKLSEQTGETVHLGVLTETDIMSIEAVNGQSTLKSTILIGKRTPLYCTSVGKAILAFQPPQIQNEIIDKTNFIKFTENTIVDREALIAELKLTYQRGYAVDDMEHEIGVRCIAAPIWDASGHVVASLSVSGPSIRINEVKIPELAQLVIRTTGEISKELGAKII
jgi:IclR family KDG regulon transcriptional repressor